jgi:glycosyltransferase involved in cell wall biosynthesis
MKIAFIAHVFPRLHNTFILNEIVELIEQGHEVHVFSIYPSTETTINADVKSYNLLDRTYYFSQFAQGEVPSHFAKYQEVLAESLPYLAAVSEKIRAEKFDVIHGILGNRPATVSMLLSELSGVPFTFEAHAYDLFVDFPFAQEKLAKARFVSTESNYNRNYLIEAIGADPNKVHIVPLAPNKKMLDRVEKKEALPNLIVSACRLHPIKGLTYALQAVAKAKESIPDLQYIILGDGELNQDLMQETISLGLEGSVGFTSDVTNEEVCEVVRRSSVFILPCVISANGDRDGTPTAIAEAQYLGVPIISSNISGLPELVEDGVSGILTEPEDVDAIARGIISLMRDPALRARMGAAGRRIIEQKYNITTNVAQLAAHWQNALYK